MAMSVTKPTVGGSENTWGTTINTGLDTLVDALNGTSGTVAPDLSTLTISGTDVTATAAELNTLDGVTATTAELNTLDGVTATTAELNTLDGVDTSGTGFGFVPAGGIIMWSGSIANIPSGWTLCDGIDHGDTEVPDLRDRFVVGAGSTYDVGDADGGTATLTEANMPAHTHSATSTSTSTVSDPGHDHNARVASASPSAASGSTKYAHGTGPAYFPTDTATTGISVSTSTTTTIGPKGSGTAFDIIPKYYALAYIMKL